MTIENTSSVPAEAPGVPEAPTTASGSAPVVESAPAEPTSHDDVAAEASTASEPEKPKVELHWYVVKVQSGREESIKESIERRVKIENLQDYFGQIVIPTEKVSEMRNGKRVVRERKLLHGYILVNVEFNEHMLYLFRETSGVGDFVGAGLNKKPIPMGENEIKKWIGKDKAGEGQAEPTDIPVSPYNEGDHVKVKDGMFQGMEGFVKQLIEAKGAVVVELTIFGRPVPVELEYWQVEFV